MKIKIYAMLLFAVLTSAAASVLAQSRQNQSDPAGAACGLMGCGVFGIIYLLIMLVILAIGITITVLIIKWIRKDAMSRGMANADTVKWWGLLGLLGLLIYILTRPDGGMPPGDQPPPPSY